MLALDETQPSPNFQDVEEKINQRVDTSLHFAGLTHVKETLHPSGAIWVPPNLKKLADTIVLLEHNKDWGTDGFYPPNLAGKTPLFFPMLVREVCASNVTLRGFHSWLYFGKRKGLYGAVIVDEDTLDTPAFFKTDLAPIYKNYLFLHELSHMILHRSLLQTRQTAAESQWRQGGQAEIWMEDEADYGTICIAKRLGFEIPMEFLFRHWPVFTFRLNDPTAVRTFAFTATSRGNPSTWKWSFGDGNASSEQNPIHTYSAAGKYSVTLEIETAYGPRATSHEVVAN